MQRAPLKIAVLGAGAMGSWMGGKLAAQLPGIQLLTTNDAHRQAINQNGLILKDTSGEQRVDVAVLHPAEFKGSVDIVLLLTKSFQSDSALSSIAGSLSDTTYVASLQNGLGNLEAIVKFVPPQRVILGNTMMPVDKLAPGVVEAKGQGSTFLNALYPSAMQACEYLLNALLGAGLEAQLDDEILQRIWGKVAFNVGMNALSALSHGTPGTIGESPGARKLAEDAASEAVSVAAAQGINVSLENVQQAIQFACRQHPDHKPSMLQDLLAGKRTEVEALNGEIVRQGEKFGVPTPTNKVLHVLVQLAELSHQRYR